MVVKDTGQPAGDSRERERTTDAPSPAAAGIDRGLGQLLMRIAPEGIWVVDSGGRISEVNPAVCAMTGYTAAELVGKHISEIRFEAFPGQAGAQMARIREQGYDRFESALRRKDGTLVPVEASAGVFGPGDPRIVSFIRDITGRKKVEEELRESQRVLLQSQEIARIGSYVYDASADWWTASVGLEEVFGIGPDHPRSIAGWLQLVHPDDRAGMADYFASLLAGGSRFDREYRFIHQSTGETRWAHGLGELERNPDGTASRLVGTIQDVTRRKTLSLEREALQSQLALASRLAAMGTLVAGVAHEINNPLVATLTGQGIALEEAREARESLGSRGAGGAGELAGRLDAIVEALEEANQGGKRVADIVKDLATFANPDPRRTRLRLEDAVAAAIRWVPTALGEVVDIRVQSRDAPPVVASAGQVQQVVVNLLTNAAKATPPGNRGEVLVRVGPGSPGMARLEVVDHGSGIDPAIRDQIFEPFFTTRRVGQGRGAGLGLAIAHAIVTAHGGTIAVESELGQGSTFRVELPAAPVER